MPEKTPKPEKLKGEKVEASSAETEAEAHAANPAHNHGPQSKRPGFGQNKFGGPKPKGPSFTKKIVRGANRGR